MKAMILAAGRGARMRHLTTDKPKPLLKLGEKRLIEYQIEAIRNAGINNIVINLGYLGDKIKDYLGSGKKYNVDLFYSKEPQTGLETGGGVYQALPFFENQPFLLTNADTVTDYDYRLLTLKKDIKGIHLVLVDNPDFKAQGDFSLEEASLKIGHDYTFSGISVIHPSIFLGCSAGFYPIAPILKAQIKKGLATGEIYHGKWFNLGTPEQLESANQLYQKALL